VQAWPVRLTMLSGGRPGRRPVRRRPGRPHRSTPGGRSSAANIATACARRRHAPRGSAGTTAFCAPARSGRAARLGASLGSLRGGAWDLVGEGRCQPSVTLVDPDLDRGMLAEQVGDALGLGGCLVVHATGTHGAAPQCAAVPVAAGGGLDGVLLALARNERPPSWSVRPRPANLGLGGVDPQLDPAGVGVGDRVG
jgi:hypothetical protein